MLCCRPFVLAQTANAENRDPRAECSASKRTDDPNPGGFHFKSRSLPSRSLASSCGPFCPPLRSQSPRTSPNPRKYRSRRPQHLRGFSLVFAAIRGPTEYRGARIRTGDLADPNGARYQAAPRPDADTSIPQARLRPQLAASHRARSLSLLYTHARARGALLDTPTPAYARHGKSTTPQPR